MAILNFWVVKFVQTAESNHFWLNFVICRWYRHLYLLPRRPSCWLSLSCCLFESLKKEKRLKKSSKGGKRALILWNFCKMSKQLPLVNVRTCNSGFAANFLFCLCSLWKVSFIIFFPRGGHTFLKSHQNSFISAISQYFIWNCSGFKGQLNSEWIYEVIISSKIPTKNYRDFCPTF